MSNLRIQKKRLKNELANLKAMLDNMPVAIRREYRQPLMIKAAITVDSNYSIYEAAEVDKFVVQGLSHEIASSPEFQTIIKNSISKENHPFEFVDVFTAYLEVLPPYKVETKMIEGEWCK